MEICSFKFQSRNGSHQCVQQHLIICEKINFLSLCTDAVKKETVKFTLRERIKNKSESLSRLGYTPLFLEEIELGNYSQNYSTV